MQGRHLGRPPVRPRGAYYDCDGDALLFVVEQEGTGACHTGEHSCFFRAFGGARRDAAPDRATSSVELAARAHGRPGLARAARRPRDAGRGVRQARRRRPGLPARVGRARRALGPLLVPRPRPGGHARARAAARSRSTGTLPDGVPLDQGMLAALEALLARLPRADRCPSCRRCTAASSATSATTSSARSSTCPTCRPTTSACPTRCCRVIGQLAAFDHFRQRVYLIENVSCSTPDRPTTTSTRAYDDAIARLDAAVADSARPLPYAPLVAPPSPTTPLPDVHVDDGPTTVPARGRGGARSTSSPATSSRSCSRSASTSTSTPTRSTSTACCARSTRRPYMYFLRHPEVTIVGSSPEPMVQLLDGRVISPADRRHPPPRAHRGARPPPRRPSCVEHPKERAEHVMLVDLARNDVGRVVRVRHRAGRRADDARALQPRHAPHVAGVGRARRRARTPIDVLRATLPGRHRAAARRRCGRWRSSTSSSRSKRGPYAGVVGYVDFSGNLDTAIAIRTMFVGADGRASVQAGAGIVADSIPDDEDLECRNKAAGVARRGPRRATHEHAP